MNPRDEIRDFLATRRARLTPEQAGLPVYGANRRVTGLRREEVALLAGISVEYYTRLERGSVGSVSDGVLDGIAHALQLDEAERDHLVRLVRAGAVRRPARRAPATRRVRPTIRRMLDLMPAPASLRNGRFDILAANDVRYHRTGTKRFHHPLVGDLTLDFESFDLPGDTGQRLNVYLAPPDSPSAEALTVLASWIAPEPVRPRADP